MVEPTGYTALDLIGFTDKGSYDPLANYVRNDLVHVGNSTWRCKIDDTTGITPTEGANWTIFIESATSLSGMSDVDLNTPKAGDGLVHNGNDWTNIPIMTKEQWKKNGAYNILEITATTQAVSGVTYTVNSNKTITAVSDGTNSNSYLPLTTTWKAPVTGKYKFVGCPSGGASNKYMMYIAEAGQPAMAYDYGDGAEVNLTAGTTYYVYIVVANSQTVNITFKPMLTTDLNATYDDYVPHAKTNRELTEDIKESSTTVSLSLSGNSSTKTIYKWGKVCEFLFQIGGSSFSSATGFDLVGTVPDGYRPKQNYTQVVSGRSTGAWASATQYHAFVTIETNGKIYLMGKASDIQSCLYFEGTLSYLTN